MVLTSSPLSSNIGHMKNIIEKIEAYRESKNVSKRVFYGALPISENYIYKLLNESRQPGLQFLTAIANEYPELKSDIQEVIFGTESASI